MEMIFIVSLMCYFKQSVSLFPSWCFNQCSPRETAIHHHNGCRDAVNVNCRIWKDNKTMHISMCSLYWGIIINYALKRFQLQKKYKIMHCLKGYIKLLKTRNIILIDRCVFKWITADIKILCDTFFFHLLKFKGLNEEYIKNCQGYFFFLIKSQTTEESSILTHENKNTLQGII